MRVFAIDRRILPPGLLVLTFASATFGADPSSQPTSDPVTAPAPAFSGITDGWFGYRSKLADVGLNVTGFIDYDFSKNFHGGVSTADSAGREIANLDFTLTSAEALGWNGGTFFLNFQDHEGENGTQKLTGDAQGFDNQDGPRAIQLYMAWYQQTLDDGKVRIKIGRVDANTEFAFVSNGTAFLNSTFGFSPAIVGLPTYPDPGLSANLFWMPSEHLSLGAGVYDSNRTERSLIFSGEPYELKPTTGGIFSIVEGDGKWSLVQANLPGRLGVGGYYHNGQFPRFDGAIQSGAGGMYAVFDQTLWRPPGSIDGGNTGIGVFAQGATGDANVNLIDWQSGSGLAWTGPIPTVARAADILGIGATYAHFSRHADLSDDGELAIELFYKIQITTWCDIQPDVQYIVHPGGDGKPDAVVGTVRVEIDF
jgi:porin